MNNLIIPSPFDAHVHLRQGDLAKLVVPHVKLGGIKLAYVMVFDFILIFLICSRIFANSLFFQPS